jgi:hypothetical protein
MVRKVSALKVGKDLGQLLEGVYRKGDQYVIERDGQPMAAVVPVWQLKEWRDRRARFFEKVDELRSTGKKRRPQLVEREVRAAVRAVRGDRRRTG